MAFKAILSICFMLVGTILCLPQRNFCDEGGAEYWCKDAETASKCGMLAYCKLNHPEMMKNTVKTSVLDADPVFIELYYESLCDGCHDFIIQQLFPTHQKLSSSGIMKIGLYPYGNAEEKKNKDGSYSYTCQHGADECMMNVLETCAIHILQDQAAFMPYIHCIESRGPSIPNAKACAEKLKADWSQILTCMNSTQGNKLEHEMRVKTDALNPKHYFVPWITMNGKHSFLIQFEATHDLMLLVCDNYEGTKPQACIDHKVKVAGDMKENF